MAADNLTAAVDALLGNVFAHTPDGTPFAVRLAREVGKVGEVVLTGPGGGAQVLLRLGPPTSPQDA
ncbi:hypothetical protein [Micromonospora sp. NPDC050276]|uniref:hypothetical protein n=1 Tax=Micromonospora sp. NPDC050276 TaxID=3364278 RepID=UPI003787FF99